MISLLRWLNGWLVGVVGSQHGWVVSILTARRYIYIYITVNVCTVRASEPVGWFLPLCC